MCENYRISIVSVVYNAEDVLGRMIESVIRQTYNNLELVIMDGGSSDGTVEIIKEYEEYVDFWKSEADEGIYHAMNKGAQKATGDYLYFLNADDWFYDSDVLKRIIQEIGNKQYELVYGNVVRIYPSFEVEIVRDFNKFALARGKIPPHQASFISKRVFWSLQGYQERYQSAGDLDFFCRLEERSPSYKYLDESIACVSSGGFSSRKDISSPEVVQVIKKYYGPVPAARVQARLAVERIIKSTLLRVGLRDLYQKMLKYKMREV